MSTVYDKLAIAMCNESTTTQDMTEIYDSWADEYEQFFVVEQKLSKPDPVLVAAELAAIQCDRKDCRVLDVAAGTGLVGLEFYDQHFKYDLGIVASELSALQGAQKDGRVLDVAAGTGLLALELRNRGFTNVDGLDASQIMLDVAQKKCLYVNTFCRWFTSDPSEGMEMDSYDAVISTGSFTKKHLHPSCLIEFLRLAKPGGLVVIGISESTYDTLKEFESVLEECIKARRCDLLKKTRYECFNFNKKPGFVFAIQKN